MLEKKLWGVAAAIQKETYTISIVSGTQKDTIQVVSTYTTNHHNNFTAYQYALHGAIQYCLTQQENNLPLTIVEGCATGADLSDLQKGTNNEIKDLVKDEIEQKFPKKTHVFPWEYTCSTGNSIQSDDKHFVFQTAQKQQGDVFNAMAESIHPGITRRLKYQIHKYALGGYQDTTEVKPTIEAIATIVAENYKQRRQMMEEQIGGFGFGKFSNISGPTDIRNTIFEYPNLKEIYGQKLLLEMGNTHWNVCLKSAFDPHNPPFTDVTATCLGDQMDAENNTSPGLVQIQPSPTILGK